MTKVLKVGDKRDFGDGDGERRRRCLSSGESISGEQVERATRQPQD